MGRNLTNPASEKRLPDLPQDLITAKELAALCWEKIRVRINSSKLCLLRAKGLPYVSVSQRGYRYQYDQVATWILLQQSWRGRANLATAYPAGVSNTTPLIQRPTLRRISGGEV